MLPQDFLNRMSDMLGDEYPAFLKSYDAPRRKALRVNTLKADKARFLRQAPAAHVAAAQTLVPVPWAENGFYYGAEDAPGRHPYHEAGVYYIQEPSAMAPAEFLMRPIDGRGFLEHERILDLCAAPGGKSTQIAAAMQGKGILVCNEIHPARARILSENTERMGIVNAMVTNETPQRLAEHFPEYFTRILVDAPCSGEGMFRKNEDACGEWSLANVELCANRQDEILDCAAAMLAPGGRLLYSTCTFAPMENEGSVSRFLLRHPEFYIERLTPESGMRGGVPEWAESPLPGLSGTIRLWPHCLKGEGHYLAALRREGTVPDMPGICRNAQEPGLSERVCRLPGKGCVEYLDFVKETLSGEAAERFTGKYLRFGEQLYLIPQGMPAVKGLKTLRPGLHLGTVKKNRFEPAHALALALSETEVRHVVHLPSEGREIRAYLNGETFPCEGEKGWYLVTVDGYAAGWGKLAGGIMKNHYPRGLRKSV